MTGLILRNKLWIVIMLILAFSLFSTNAFAWGGHPALSERPVSPWGGHGRYYWHGNGWYKSGWFWGGVAVSALVIGAVVASLPPHYSVVYVGGVPYYYDGAYYYQTYRGGYMVVANPTVVVPAAPAPVVVAPAQPPVIAPAPAGTNAVTINVPNASGGFTPVTLTKYRDGYRGPQGEYYQGNSTVDQLRVLYGK